MRTWKLACVIALALLALGAAGCGGESSSDGVAAIDTNDGGSGGSSGGAGDGGDADGASGEEARLEWAQCMREQGVDVGDPDENGMFQITPETGGDPSQAGFSKAREECGDPPGLDDLEPPSPAEAKKMQESLLAFARCMRSEGIDIPDPTFSGNGGASVALPDPDEVKTPEFRAAQEACSKHLQLPGRGSETP
jgi:hypothetical protein